MTTFEIGDYIAAAVVFTMVIAATTGILAEVYYKDSTFINDTNQFNNFSKTFNETAELTSQMTTLKTNLSNADLSSAGGIFGSIPTLFQTAFIGVRFVLSSFNIMGDAYNGLSTFLGVPNWVGSLLSLIVTILIIFAIYKLIFRSATA